MPMKVFPFTSAYEMKRQQTKWIGKRSTQWNQQNKKGEDIIQYKGNVYEYNDTSANQNELFKGSALSRFGTVTVPEQRQKRIVTRAFWQFFIERIARSRHQYKSAAQKRQDMNMMKKRVSYDYI